MKITNFFIGIFLFFLIIFLPIPLEISQKKVLAVCILMAYFWIFEVIPIYITSLFPLLLFPILKVLTPQEASYPYAQPEVYLFLGGFFIAKAMEKHNLHKRISFFFLKIFPKKIEGVLLGIMFSVCFLSGWMSNTATCIMAFPIVLAILKSLNIEKENINKAFFLSIAYASSIGGISTPIGTPPNIVFLGQFKKLFPELPDITFAKWCLFGFPLSLTFLIITWLLFYLIFLRKENIKIGYEKINEEREKIGKMKLEEKIILGVFVFVALLWLTRNIWERKLNLKNFSHDALVAILGALILFIIPYKEENKLKPILDWETALNIPWGILLIFGGGFSLASAFEKTNLTQKLSEYLKFFGNLNIVLFVTLLSLFLVFLTEVTSNTATATIILPFLGSLSKAININPLFLMLPATISVSFAFMLPSGTPPNAIVFASGKVRIKDMAKTGIILNFLGTFLVVAFFFLFIKHILKI
uniref:SLC13/DASS family transporter n=1 Tax=candidate division WOR-3 bacterium TaxID=2052148 RepID=A0A7V4E1Y6_UNCW3